MSYVKYIQQLLLLMFVNSIKELRKEYPWRNRSRESCIIFFFLLLTDRKTSEMTFLLTCIEHAYIKLTILRDNRTTSDDDEDS